MYGACRLTLLGRSRSDSDLALVRWEQGGQPGATGSPLRRVHAQSHFLCNASQQQVVPVHDAAMLRQVAPGQFDEALIRATEPTWWRHVLDGFTNPAPWHIVVVLIVWAVCVAYIVWRLVNGFAV